MVGAVKVTVTQDNVTDQGDKKDPVKEEADGVVGLKHNTMIPCWDDMEHTWGWWNTVVEHSGGTQWWNTVWPLGGNMEDGNTLQGRLGHSETQ